MESGIQSPQQTLASRTGSCRDVAWLLQHLAVELGFRARFGTGCLIECPLSWSRPWKGLASQFPLGDDVFWKVPVGADWIQVADSWRMGATLFCLVRFVLWTQQLWTEVTPSVPSRLISISEFRFVVPA